MNAIPNFVPWGLPEVSKLLALHPTIHPRARQSALPASVVAEYVKPCSTARAANGQRSNTITTSYTHQPRDIIFAIQQAVCVGGRRLGAPKKYTSIQRQPRRPGFFVRAARSRPDRGPIALPIKKQQKLVAFSLFPFIHGVSFKHATSDECDGKLTTFFFSHPQVSGCTGMLAIEGHDVG